MNRATHVWGEIRPLGIAIGSLIGEEIAEMVGESVRHVYKHDGLALSEFNIEFNVSILVGGQVNGEPMRLFMIYSAGNFI